MAANLINKGIIQMPDLKYIANPKGVGHEFYQKMLQNKDQLAQIYGPTGEKDTFGNLLQRSIRTAISMKKFGVKPGDYVSICSFNHLDSCTPVIASLFVGSIMVPLDPTIALEDIVHLLKDIPPKLIFVLREAIDLIEKVIERLSLKTTVVVFGQTDKYVTFSKFLQPSEEEASFKPFEVDDVKDTAMIFFTSGTTGLPKGIYINHLCILSHFANFGNIGFPLDFIFSYASPYWSVFIFFLGVSITKATTRLVVPKFIPGEVWSIFEYKMTFVFLNTTQLLSMMCQGRPEHLDLSSVKDIMIGGGALKLDQMLEARKLLPEARIHSGYGLSEVAGLLATFKPNDLKHLEFLSKKPDSCGTGMDGMSYKIVNVETEEILGPYQEGELRIKTEFKLSGYHNADVSSAWDLDGWLYTGDIAYYDDDQCFYIVDRIKEMFKFQSWHIVPAVLESVLLTHPAVALALVIGMPHDLDGEHPMGIVVLKQSHKNVTDRDIEKYVEERVQDRQRLRAGVKILDSFPFIATGKIDRKKIKAMALQGRL